MKFSIEGILQGMLFEAGVTCSMHAKISVPMGRMHEPLEVKVFIPEEHWEPLRELQRRFHQLPPVMRFTWTPGLLEVVDLDFTLSDELILRVESGRNWSWGAR
jgi:hypothetical protein